jgi:hypothetical protein
MGDLGGTVGQGISDLIGGVFDAIGAGLRGIVASLQQALPNGLLIVVVFVLLLIAAWALAKR